MLTGVVLIIGGQCIERFAYIDGVVEIEQQNVIAAINQVCERLNILEGDTNDIRIHMSEQLDYMEYKLGNCQSLAQSAYECANVSYSYERVLDEIVERVTESVAERVLDRVWKMIDDAKDAPSEKEFLTGIERLLLK